jgi:hypothetical protein
MAGAALEMPYCGEEQVDIFVKPKQEYLFKIILM